MGSTDAFEIAANLWFIHDEQGTIYSLRGRLYLTAGSDADKLAMLRRQAEVDYFIARPFPIPERLHTTFVLGGERHKMAVVNRDSLAVLGGEDVLLARATGWLGGDRGEGQQLGEPWIPAARQVIHISHQSLGECER